MGYGLYKGLEAAGKIDATRAFFSDNYEAMLGGLGGIIGVIGLGFLVYRTICRSPTDEDVLSSSRNFSDVT